MPTRIGVRSTITVTYLSPVLVWCHMYPQSIHRCRRIVTLRTLERQPTGSSDHVEEIHGCPSLAGARFRACSQTVPIEQVLRVGRGAEP